jgi:hypothetical protein
VKSRYVQRTDGEWFHIPRRGHIISCCDCGLAHLFYPRVRKGRVEIKVYRLRRNTASRRRAMGVRLEAA